MTSVWTCPSPATLLRIWLPGTLIWDSYTEAIWVSPIWTQSEEPLVWAGQPFDAASDLGVNRDHFIWELYVKSSIRGHKQGNHRFAQWKYTWSRKCKLVFLGTLQFSTSLKTAEHIAPSHHLPRQWSSSRGCERILFRWELCQMCVHESFSTAVG